MKGQNKQNFYNLQIWIYNSFRIMHSFPKADAENCLKRNPEHESILNNPNKLLVD